MKNVPSFWLAGSRNHRISKEFATPTDLLTYAASAGLLADKQISVRDYSVSGPVPLSLFAEHVHQGLLPAGSDLVHFNIPTPDNGYRRALVATPEEAAALLAGTLTEVCRRVERITTVYRQGAQKGMPKYLSVPSLNPLVSWTLQMLRLGFPCFYAQVGSPLTFEQYPDYPLEVTAIDYEVLTSGGKPCWAWVLKVRPQY